MGILAADAQLSRSRWTTTRTSSALGQAWRGDGRGAHSFVLLVARNRRRRRAWWSTGTCHPRQAQRGRRGRPTSGRCARIGRRDADRLQLRGGRIRACAAGAVRRQLIRRGGRRASLGPRSTTWPTSSPPPGEATRSAARWSASSIRQTTAAISRDHGAAGPRAGHPRRQHWPGARAVARRSALGGGRRGVFRPPDIVVSRLGSSATVTRRDRAGRWRWWRSKTRPCRSAAVR